MLINNYEDFQVTLNFNTKEFHCKDGSRVPAEYLPNVVYLALNLQKFRNLLGNVTIYINSAYRSKTYNSKIGGVPKSNHLTARAVDIQTQKYLPDELYKKLREFIELDYLPDGEIIKYGTFIHYAPRYELKHAKIHYDEYF